MGVENRREVAFGLDGRPALVLSAAIDRAILGHQAGHLELEEIQVADESLLTPMN